MVVCWSSSIMLLVWISMASSSLVSRQKRSDVEICHPSDGRLFRIYTSPAKPWTSARDACVTTGGKLATVKDETTFHLIRNFITSNPNVATDIRRGLWIGLDDRSKEGDFYWADGEPLGEYQPWSSGNPNNDNKKDSCHGQDCVQLWKPKNWLFDDDYCQIKSKSYICEYADQCV